VRLLPLLLIALAHAPLLYVYFQQLWSRPHYQFFPLVLAASAWFVWSRWEQRVPSGSRSLWVSRGLLAASAVLLALAFLRLSTLAAFGSFLLVAGAFLLRSGIPALGPWLLLLLVVRIPYGQDVALIQWMQRLTSRLSSTALDTIGVEHIADGNVLLFPQTSLFVEEACSGVVSLLAIVACAGILAVWWRRSIVHAVLMIATAVFLAGAMNVVRVVTIAVALDSFDVDLSEGWRHELLGLVIFAVSLGALFSLDRFYYFLLGPIHRNPLAPYWDLIEDNVVVDFWNHFVGREAPEEELAVYDQEDDEAAVSKPERTATALTKQDLAKRSLGFTVDWGIAGVFLLILAGQVYAGIGPFSVAPDISPVALDLNEDSLPQHFGEWERKGFEVQERDRSSAFGEHSRIWAYQRDEMLVRISVDFVFPEWHALTACYSGVGWTLESSHWQESDHGQFVEATFQKPGGESALLMFDLFDTEGRPYEAPAGTFVHRRLRRVFSGESSRWTLPNYYQIQALAVNPAGPATSEQRQAVRELFAWFREQMREQLGGASANAVSVSPTVATVFKVESAARRQPAGPPTPATVASPPVHVR
jgi:exosortase